MFPAKLRIKQGHTHSKCSVIIFSYLYSECSGACEVASVLGQFLALRDLQMNNNVISTKNLLEEKHFSE